MKSKFATDSGILLNIGERIAKGGEGEVFEITNIPGMLFKSYYSGMRSNERMNKLKYMCSNKPLDISSEKFRICWPNEIVYENGEFAGFIMQKAFDLSITPYHLCQLTIPEKFSNYWKTTYDRTNIHGRINRLMLSANIAAAIHRIHSSGKYIIADFKPQNLLITVDGKVSLIDLDSVQVSVNNTILFKAPVSTPEYTPPEAKKTLKSGHPITESWDSFSFGILIYEILCGIHPYAGTAHPPFDNHSTIAEKIENNLTYLYKDKSYFKVLPPPHSNFDVFSPTLQNVIKSIFQNGQSSNNRPSIKLIGDSLANEVQFTLSQKEKLECQNAIQNYHKAEKQIENLHARIEKLINVELFTKDEIIKEKVEKIESWRAGFFITLVISLVFVVIMISLNQDSNLNTTNIQDLNNKLKSENNVLLVENVGLKSKISSLESTNTQLRSKISSLESTNTLLKKETNSFSGNFIPPILVADIKYKSVNSNGTKTFIDYGATLKGSNLYFLIPKIEYYGVIPGTYNLHIKIIEPNGSLSRGTSSPTGYSYNIQIQIGYGKNSIELLGWGNDEANSYSTGAHKFEIWSNSRLLYSNTFNVY
jgi:hypothetical protein